jgi:hypothetical protein
VPALIDAALAVLVLAGAIFLGAVGLALIKTVLGDKNDDKKSK